MIVTGQGNIHTMLKQKIFECLALTELYVSIPVKGKSRTDDDSFFF